MMAVLAGLSRLSWACYAWVYWWIFCPTLSLSVLPMQRQLSLAVCKLENYWALKTDLTNISMKPCGNCSSHIPDETHIASMLMGSFSLLLLILFKKFAPKLPGILVTVVIATLVSWLTHFDADWRENCWCD